jgi:hypothetical protein
MIPKAKKPKVTEGMVYITMQKQRPEESNRRPKGSWTEKGRMQLSITRLIFQRLRVELR